MAVFQDLGNGRGEFTGTPDFTDSGSYHLTFIARDNRGGEDRESMSITVLDVNHPSQLDLISHQYIREGEELEFTVRGSDFEGDSFVIAARGVPSWAYFTDHGDGTGTFLGIPRESTAGTYVVIFLASDNHGVSQQSVKITVENPKEDLKISTARLLNEMVLPEDYARMYVAVANNGNEILKDVQVHAYLSDFGVKGSGGEFTLTPGQEKSQNLFFEIPAYALPGDYYVKISVGNQKFQETTYRSITII